jgi:hypothetical protein
MTRRLGVGVLGVDGAAAVELAITISLLAILMLGIADYGTLMNTAAGLVGASRAGAEYAIANGVTATTGTETQVCRFYGVSGTSCSPVTPGAQPLCTCVDGSWPQGTACPPSSNPCLTVTNPYLSGNPIDGRVLQYMDVTATIQNYSPLLPVKNFGVIAPTTFGFPATLTGTAVARMQ